MEKFLPKQPDITTKDCLSKLKITRFNCLPKFLCRKSHRKCIFN